MIIGSNLVFVKQTDSTNTLASQLLKNGQATEGTVVYTDFQKAGRGQKGNCWISEESKNLLISIVLLPESILPENQFIISMFISLGICDFLKAYLTESKIKWPNDIYAGDDKIAGILIENSISGRKIISTIAGIGININQVEFPSWIPNPVSLKALTNKDYDTDVCLKQLLNHLDRRYKEIISGKTGEVINEYISQLLWMGEIHEFKTGLGMLKGKIISVTDSGCLVIEDMKKNSHEFRFKEVDFIS